MGNYWLHDLDETGKSPLTRASLSGRTELTTVMLMQETLDVPEHIRGLPELHRAACWGFDDSIDELIVSGASPDLRDDSGETPLHKAARLGHLRAVKCLLAHGFGIAIKRLLEELALVAKGPIQAVTADTGRLDDVLHRSFRVALRGKQLHCFGQGGRRIECACSNHANQNSHSVC